MSHRFTGQEVASLLAGGAKPAQVRSVLSAYDTLSEYLGEDAEGRRERGAPDLEVREISLGEVWAIPLGGDDYPAQLAAAPSPPVLLFGRGDPAALRLGVGVVGTRNITKGGEAVARTAVEGVASVGGVVHSGLAFGCDAAAHRAALDQGVVTVAVLASGCDLVTPKGNSALGEEILGSGGAIVSEQLPGTPVYRQNLMARNRIVCGLSTALVVCEASLKSGTMGAVRNMLAAGRDLIVPVPRDGSKGPGVEALAALTNPEGVDPAVLGVKGALAEAVRQMRPVARYAPTDRDALRAAVAEAWNATDLA